MKPIKTIVLSTLAATLLLIAVSCGNISNETHSDIIREEIALATRPYNAENDIAAVSLTTPPAVGISYQYKVGGEGLVDTVITGPGKVMLQTMPIYKVASAIQPYIVQSK